jgi:hypothetical protein
MFQRNPPKKKKKKKKHAANFNRQIMTVGSTLTLRAHRIYRRNIRPSGALSQGVAVTVCQDHVPFVLSNDSSIVKQAFQRETKQKQDAHAILKNKPSMFSNSTAIDHMNVYVSRSIHIYCQIC